MAATSPKSLRAHQDALSPRHLGLITGFFVVALGILLTTKFFEEAEGRRVETELRVAYAAEMCVDGLNLAAVTGASVRQTLASCAPGGAGAVYHLTMDADVLNAFGRTEAAPLEAKTAAGLPLETRGDAILHQSRAAVRASWRRLANGEAVLVAAPARDLYQRTPLWLAYALILGAITLVVAALMAAFVRQARTSAGAGRALDALHHMNDALTAGRCSPWRYDGRSRTVRFARSFLGPVGLGARDRKFSLREIAALTHPEDLRDTMGVLTGDIGGHAETEMRMRRPNGSWARILLRAAEPEGRRARRGVAVDLTGAEPANAAAALAETRLRDAIESVPDAFVLWDAGGRLAAWNRRFAAAFGFQPGDLSAGMEASAVSAAARAAGDVLEKYFAPTVARGDDDRSVEAPVRPDLWLRIARRRTAEGGVVCLATNVSDLKKRADEHRRRERQLQDTVDALESAQRDAAAAMRNYQLEKRRAEDASRAKSEFLANMSHELRTPLNAINGFSEIMRSELYGPLGDDKYKEYVGDILASGAHLLDMIDDILDMSKIEAGGAQLDQGAVDVERLASECARLVAKQAIDKGVTFDVDAACAPPVWADRRAAKQVVLNLLSNAVKFTDPGGAIRLSAEADLDAVAIVVADDGCGIEPKRLRRLGAPFVAAEPGAARPGGGSGLGLALSKSLMEMQGGLLAVESALGRGTTAAAVFPRRDGASVSAPASNVSASPVPWNRSTSVNVPLAPVAELNVPALSPVKVTSKPLVELPLSKSMRSTPPSPSMVAVPSSSSTSMLSSPAPPKTVLSSAPTKM
ncbi:MAG: PAS domain-containing sensor histidine kinase, partial [Pseudomonadota bacterium]